MRVLLLMWFILVLTAVGFSQDLTCLSVSDQKAFRQVIADREFYKAQYDESERQRKAVEASRDQWQALYQAEKDRADRVQQGRVDETKAEAGDLRLGLQKAQDQISADTAEIGRLNAKVIGLKAQRKWWLGLGAGVGAIGGYYIGHNQTRIIQSIVPPASTLNFQTSFKF